MTWTWHKVRPYTPCENPECTLARSHKAYAFNDLPKSQLRQRCGSCNTKFNHAKFRARSSSADRNTNDLGAGGGGKGGRKGKSDAKVSNTVDAHTTVTEFIDNTFPTLDPAAKQHLHTNLSNLSAKHGSPEPEQTIGSAKHHADIADKAVKKCTWKLSQAESAISRCNAALTEAFEAYDLCIKELEEARAEQQRTCDLVAAAAHHKKEQSISIAAVRPVVSEHFAGIPEKMTFKEHKKFVEEWEAQIKSHGLSEDDMDEEEVEFPRDEPVDGDGMSAQIDQPGADTSILASVDLTEPEALGLPAATSWSHPEDEQTEKQAPTAKNRSYLQAASISGDSNKDSRGRSRSPEMPRQIGQALSDRATAMQLTAAPAQSMGWCG